MMQKAVQNRMHFDSRQMIPTSLMILC